MSAWKHKLLGPHLSRSPSCPCSRKKHFLALVSSQGSLAGHPVSGGAGHPVRGPWGPLEPLGGQTGQTGQRHHSACISWGVGLPQRQPLRGRKCSPEGSSREDPSTIFVSCPHLSSATFFFAGAGGASSYGILVPWSGIELMPLAVRAPSPIHWTVREFPQQILFKKTLL